MRSLRDDAVISVDIEANGPIPDPYSLLSLGATCVWQPEETFYVEVRPLTDTFVPAAMAVCEQSGLTMERLWREGIPPEQAMLAFVEWAVARGTRPVFASFSTWDWVYVYWYLMRFVGASPFGHSSLDMKSLYAGVYDTDWRGTTKSQIAAAHPEVLAGAGEHDHHALHDAREQGILLARLIEQRGEHLLVEAYGDPDDA